ncbi:MAG: indolepyruvate ferredoxin oxidoreductase subunit alpha [Oscillospiraceae bacterium]|nr:indolepyruvate ferredoxin oxidoreductase subunit alpha [Oscillospiraceae bacterium]
MKQLLMGNEAIALGAIRAGIGFASGYPGTPSTEILETLAKNNDGSFYIEWSVNEKCALETAAGAAFTGVRALVTMKQVGLNAASDPLMSLNYVGVKGGMVVVVADDPGPISSQTEQDTRHFGIYAKLAVFDPSSPEEAYKMIADAFELSERIGRPVLFRPTTRICHGRASVEILQKSETRRLVKIGFLTNRDTGGIADGGTSHPSRVIFPRLAFQQKSVIESTLKQLSNELSEYPANAIEGNGKLGIACGGVSYAYVKEACRGEHCSPDNNSVPAGAHCAPLHKLLKISAYPFPQKKALEFLDGLEKVLVIEELDPVIERELVYLCGFHHLDVEILGKHSGHIQNAGELSPDIVKSAVLIFLGLQDDTLVNKGFSEPEAVPELPVRPPVLCAGCPHRAAFFAVKEACLNPRTNSDVKHKAVYSGDIGCYTLGNAKPLEMVDTCLCMGAGITIAQGLHRAEPDTYHFSFIGDSTFFHSGITGIINAVYNQTDIIVVILDNSTTAMTGGQPHPSTGRTLMNTDSPKVSIYDIVKACGVSKLIRCNPFEVDKAINAVKSMLDEKGVRVILFEAPCIAVSKNSDKYTVNSEKCTGCGICVRKLGCPAVTLADKKALIDADSCTGCGVCANICKFNAINVGDDVHSVPSI